MSLLTLGVSELEKAVAFYRDGLGWPKSDIGGDEVAFFKTGGVVIAVFPRVSFASDAGLDLEDVEYGEFSRVSLAHNVAEERQVDEVLAEAAQAGATIVKEHRRSFSGATDSLLIPRASCGKWRGTLPSRWLRTVASNCPAKHHVAQMQTS